MPMRPTSTVVPLIFASRKRRNAMSRSDSPVARSSVSSDVGPGDLEQVPRRRLHLDVVAPGRAHELVVRPRVSGVVAVLVLVVALEDRVGGQQPVLVAVDPVLHRADREVLQAVDEDRGEELLDVGTAEARSADATARRGCSTRSSRTCSRASSPRTPRPTAGPRDSCAGSARRSRAGRAGRRRGSRSWGAASPLAAPRRIGAIHSHRRCSAMNAAAARAVRSRWSV